MILVIAVVLGLAAGLIWDRLSGSEGDTEQPAGTTGPPVLGVVREPVEEFGLSSIREGPDRLSDPRWLAITADQLHVRLAGPAHAFRYRHEPGTRRGQRHYRGQLGCDGSRDGHGGCLVDADMRRSRLHEVFGLDNGQGLTSTILDGGGSGGTPRPVPNVASLQVVTAGPPLPSAQRDEESLYRNQLPRLTSLAELVIVAGSFSGR